MTPLINLGEFISIFLSAADVPALTSQILLKKILREVDSLSTFIKMLKTPGKLTFIPDELRERLLKIHTIAEYYEKYNHSTNIATFSQKKFLENAPVKSLEKDFWRLLTFDRAGFLSDDSLVPYYAKIHNNCREILKKCFKDEARHLIVLYYARASILDKKMENSLRNSCDLFSINLVNLTYLPHPGFYAGNKLLMNWQYTNDYISTINFNWTSQSR